MKLIRNATQKKIIGDNLDPGLAVISIFSISLSHGERMDAISE